MSNDSQKTRTGFVPYKNMVDSILDARNVLRGNDWYIVETEE